MRNKSLFLFSLLIMASMILGACATPTPETIIQTQEVIKTVEVVVEGETVIVTATPEPVVEKEFASADPSTLVYTTFGEPDTLDPALDYETAGGNILANVYESLVFYNRERADEFVPALAEEVPSAENGLISEDGKTYTFNIRQGVTFHLKHRSRTQPALQLAILARAVAEALVDGKVGHPQLSAVGRQPAQGNVRDLFLESGLEIDRHLVGKLPGGILEGEGHENAGHPLAGGLGRLADLFVLRALEDDRLRLVVAREQVEPRGLGVPGRVVPDLFTPAPQPHRFRIGNGDHRIDGHEDQEKDDDQAQDGRRIAGDLAKGTEQAPHTLLLPSPMRTRGSTRA